MFKSFGRVRMQEYGVWAEHLDELVTIRCGIEMGLESFLEILHGQKLKDEIKRDCAYPGSFLKAILKNCSGIITERKFCFLVIVIDLFYIQGCHRIADKTHNTLHICFHDHTTI